MSGSDLSYNSTGESQKLPVPNFVTDGCVDSTDKSPRGVTDEGGGTFPSAQQRFSPPCEPGSPQTTQSKLNGRFSVQKVSTEPNKTSSSANPTVATTSKPTGFRGRFNVSPVPSNESISPRVRSESESSKENLLATNTATPPISTFVSAESEPKPASSKPLAVNVDRSKGDEVVLNVSSQCVSASVKTKTTSTDSEAQPIPEVNTKASIGLQTSANNALPSSNSMQTTISSSLISTNNGQQPSGVPGETIPASLVRDENSARQSPYHSPSLSRHNSQLDQIPESSLAPIHNHVTKVNSTVLEFDPLVVEAGNSGNISVQAQADLVPDHADVTNSYCSSVVGSCNNSRTASPTTMLTPSGSVENLRNFTSSAPSGIISALKKDENVFSPSFSFLNIAVILISSCLIIRLGIFVTNLKTLIVQTVS